MRPLVPEDLATTIAARRDATMRSLTRACISVGLRALHGGSVASGKTPFDFLSERGWEHDREAQLILRGAVSPAMTSQSGWAQELATVAAIFLASLRPMSAAAQLLGACLQLDFAGREKLSLPAINAGTAQW